MRIVSALSTAITGKPESHPECFQTLLSRELESEKHEFEGKSDLQFSRGPPNVCMKEDTIAGNAAQKMRSLKGISSTHLPLHTKNYQINSRTISVR